MNLLKTIVALLFTLGSACSPELAPAEQAHASAVFSTRPAKTPRMVARVMVYDVTTTYTVTEPTGFPSLPLPAHGLIFHNGVFAAPGLDYQVIGGTAFAFAADALSTGDIIAVVSLP